MKRKKESMQVILKFNCHTKKQLVIEVNIICFAFNMILHQFLLYQPHHIFTNMDCAHSRIPMRILFSLCLAHDCFVTERLD